MGLFRKTGLSGFCRIVGALVWLSSLGYGQTGSATGGSAAGGGTTSGTAGAASGMIGEGASRSGRVSGVRSSPSMGGTSNTASGLGAANRVDRSSTSSTQSPLANRGLNVMGGDPAQLQGLTGSATRQFGPTGIGGFGAGAGQPGRGGLNQNQRQSESRAQYSTRIAFGDRPPAPGTPPAAQSPEAVASVQGYLAGLPRSGIRVDLEGGVLVLRGMVATQSDRRVAERMAKLEPGVGLIRNELVVAPAGAVASPGTVD